DSHPTTEVCLILQAEDGIRDRSVTGVQTCALPICERVLSAFARRLSCTRASSRVPPKLIFSTARGSRFETGTIADTCRSVPEITAFVLERLSSIWIARLGATRTRHHDVTASSSNPTVPTRNEIAVTRITGESFEFSGDRPTISFTESAGASDVLARPVVVALLGGFA